MRAQLQELQMPDVPASSVPNGAGTQLVAVGSFVATAAGYIPYILALLPAVYYCILIWESKTIQEWVAKRRARKAAQKLAKAQAAVIVTTAKGDAAAVVAQADVKVATAEIKSIPPTAS